MRKRITALTMAGVMTAALLSGCSGGNSTSNTTAGGAADTTGAEAAQTTAGGTEAAAGEKVEITYWDQNADTKRTEIFNKLIADFEAENPNITVKLVPGEIQIRCGNPVPHRPGLRRCQPVLDERFPDSGCPGSAG